MSITSDSFSGRLDKRILHSKSALILLSKNSGESEMAKILTVDDEPLIRKQISRILPALWS